MTEWIPAGLTPGTAGERVFAARTEAEARQVIGAAAADDPRLDGALQKSANLSGLADPAAARANLGLGDGAESDVGTAPGTVAAGDDPRITGAVQKSANLADLADPSAALAALGGARNDLSNVSGGNFEAKLEAVRPSGPVEGVLDFIPEANRAAVLAGSYTGDATAWVQAAIDTGENVDLQGLTLYCSGLTFPTPQRKLFSSCGTSNLYKSANGIILSATGNYQIFENITFRGRSVICSGDNVVCTGIQPTFLNCGSMDAAGRALRASKDRVVVRGSNPVWHTADGTASGYDIEIGEAGTATLYHELREVYSSQATGGILLTDTGSHTVVGGQFGKYTVSAGTAPAGSNGGKCIGARVLGAVTLGLASAKMAACDINGVTLTFGTGTSGCSVDESNTFATGFSVTNNGNGNNYICRNVSTGSWPILRFGAHASAVEVALEPANGLRCNYAFLAPNGFGGIKARNNANSADLNVLGVAQAADNVFVGHSSGTSGLFLTAASGGVSLDIAGTRFGTFGATQLTPNIDNAKDLGTSALRFKAGYSYAWDAAAEYRVNSTKVVGARETGWTPASGTADKATAWSSDTLGALNFSAQPTQGECNALRDACSAAFKRMKAMEDALRTHGLIGA